MDLVGANNVTQVFPVGMPNSDLVVKDEDDNIITELDQFSGDQNVPAAINIENSTDVIIGPVTQFHGPVTIYQNVNGRQAIGGSAENGSNSYLNGRVLRSESTCSDAPHMPDKATRNHPIYTKYLKHLVIPLVVLVVIIAVVLAVTLTNIYETRPPSKSLDEDDDGAITPPDFIIYDKKQWGGQDGRDLPPITHPPKFVILSHTVTPLCYSFEECSKRVSSIQTYHISKHLPDITYNFLIGGDGNAYVGRGWDHKSTHNLNDSLGVSFIGDFVKYNLTSKMISAAQRLLRFGVERGKLAQDYKIICHNQTVNTLSPGPNVYSVVKNWPHFDATNYKISS